MLFLSPTEIERLAGLIDPRYRALVLTAGYTGARFGELAALRIGREGLDLLRKRMTIRATLTEVRGHLEVGPPKTKAANRSVSLPRFIVDELAHHLENHGGDHVFTSPDGKALRRNNFRRRVWLPAVKAAGLDGVRFHDLRHSHAAMLIAAGEHPRLISGRLGTRRLGPRWTRMAIFSLAWMRLPPTAWISSLLKALGQIGGRSHL